MVTDTAGSNVFIGAVILIGFVVILLYFGMPILRRWDLDQFSSSTVQLMMSDKKDVNLVQEN